MISYRIYSNRSRVPIEACLHYKPGSFPIVINTSPCISTMLKCTLLEALSACMARNTLTAHYIPVPTTPTAVSDCNCADCLLFLASLGTDTTKYMQASPPDRSYVVTAIARCCNTRRHYHSCNPNTTLTLLILALYMQYSHMHYYDTQAGNTSLGPFSQIQTTNTCTSILCPTHPGTGYNMYGQGWVGI